MDKFTFPPSRLNPDQLKNLFVSHAFIVGYTGCPTIKLKECENLINAFGKIESEFSLSKLWIMGTLEIHKNLSPVIKEKSLKHKVVFWHDQSSQSKEHLFQHLDLLVIHAPHKTLCLDILIAGLYGIPIIISNKNKVASLIEKYQAGIILEKDDEYHLYQAILKLKQMKMNHHQYKNMKENVQKMVKEVFDWKLIVSMQGKTLKMSQEILSKYLK
ncbi:MAG: glycosyltransferase [Candidatus Cyclobacteriaceae bacterium M3_2C_046]